MAQQVTLTDLIRLDVTHGRTPDLPALRYMAKQFPVFLYDNMKDSVVAKSTLFDIEVGKDWSTRHNYARTVEKYAPWYSIKDTDEYEAYCLEDSLDSIYTDVPDYCMSDPLPMVGKVVYVSLHGLEELDYYYDNEFTFERVRIKVKPNLLGDRELDVYAYFTSIEGISKYDTESSLYKLNESVDVSPFNAVKKNGQDYYEM